MDENKEKEEQKKVSENEQPNNENVTKEEPEIIEESKETEENSIEERKEESENITEETTTKELTVTEKKKKKRKGSYISGTIGALLGGLVIAIAWVLIYVLADNIVIPIIATLIPMGAYLGYRIFRGRIGKPFPVIITIISLLLIVLVTTIVCPVVLLVEAGYSINWENVTGLYSDTRKEVRQMIIEDLVAGLAFTIIGIVIVIKFFIAKKIENLKTEEERKKIYEEKKNILKEQSQIIKNACIDLNSMNQESAIKKKEIFKQLTEIYNIKRKKAKLYFVNSLSNGLLKKYKGKYYYDETEEQEKIENVKKIKKRFILKKIIIISIILITIVSAYVIYKYYTQKNNMTLAGTEIEIEVNQETQEYFGTKEEITNKFGEEAASYCDFVLYDTAGTYELNGKAVPKSQFGDKDISAIIEEDRKDYAEILGEDTISKVMDKQFSDITIKSYNYSYLGVDGNTYKSAVYLCEANNRYIWIGVYADEELDFAEIDAVVDNFIK